VSKGLTPAERRQLIEVHRDGDGNIEWPPETGFKLFRTTVQDWESMLRVLADADIEDQSGFATSVLARRAGINSTTVNERTLELEAMGLITREKPTPQARKVRRLALAVPVETLPKHLQPLREQFADPDELADEEDNEPGQAVTIVDPEASPLDNAFAIIGHPANGGEFDYQRLARETGDYLLEQLIERANAPAADPEELARLRLDNGLKDERIERIAHDLRQSNKDNEKLLANQKELRHRLEEAEARARGLNRNLEAAIAAARDLAERSPSTAREATVRGLERLMQNRERE